MNDRVQAGISRLAWGVLATMLIAALPYEPVRADTFQPGEFVSYNTLPLGSRFGDTPNGPAGVSLEQNFDSVFASTGGLMEIGIPGTAGNSIIFDNGPAVVTFESGSDRAGTLTVDLLDPTTSSGGTFAMEIAALEVTTAFDRAGVSLFKGSSSILLQNLTLSGLIGDEQWANGLSIGQVLAESNVVLGGGPLPNNKTNLTAVFGLVDDINNSFGAGESVTAWADQHLSLPTSSGGGGGTISAPEIDPASATSGLTLLAGVLTIFRARRGVKRRLVYSEE